MNTNTYFNSMTYIRFSHLFLSIGIYIFIAFFKLIILFIPIILNFIAPLSLKRIALELKSFIFLSLNRLNLKNIIEEKRFYLDQLNWMNIGEVLKTSSFANFNLIGYIGQGIQGSKCAY